MVLLGGIVSGRLPAVTLQAAVLQQGACVSYHLRVSAKHHMAVIRIYQESGMPFQFTISQEGLYASLQHPVPLLPAERRNEGELAFMFPH